MRHPAPLPADLSPLDAYLRERLSSGPQTTGQLAKASRGLLVYLGVSRAQRYAAVVSRLDALRVEGVIAFDADAWRLVEG